MNPFLSQSSVFDPAEQSLSSAPVHEALAAGNVSLALELIDGGASIHGLGQHRRTLLHIAAMNGFKAVAETLLRRGAAIDPIDDEFWTPLHLASGHGHTMLVDILLSYGAGIDIQDDEGWTALHQAASRHFEIIRLLLERGANPNLKNSDGHTPLDLAQQQKNTEVYQLLLTHRSQSSTLCHLCKNITYSKLQLPAEQIQWTYEFQVSKDRGYLHSPSVADLKKSALSCTLCSYIEGSIIHEVSPTDGPVCLFFEVEPVSAFTGPWEREQGLLFVIVSIGNLNRTMHGTNKLGVSAEKETAAAMYGDIYIRPFPSDPICDKNVTTIKRWLSLCQETHEGCRFPPTSVMPKRLLDLHPRRSTHSCVLIETKGMGPVPYAALSYCWGNRPEQITKRANIAEYRHPHGIDRSLSPKTYQDAAHVARLLGIRYLWLDALCITQDDTEDWQEEATKMGDIYQNARVTIAATGSISTRDGFIAERRTVGHIPILYDGPGAESETSHFYIHPRFARKLETIENTTWNRRGWTMQERFLSRNVIHFTSGPIVLECRCGTWTEIHDGHAADWLEQPDANSRPYTRDDRNLVVTRHVRFVDANPYPEDWFAIVEEYQNRGLTFPDDKKWALQGMVRNLEQRIDMRYFAGLWLPLANPDHSESDPSKRINHWKGGDSRTSIHFQLLWSALGPLRTRPRSRAPSWSWVAIDGKLSFLGNAFIENAKVSDADIRVFEVSEITSDPVGVYEKLRIRGQLRKVRRGHAAKLGQIYGGEEPSTSGCDLKYSVVYRKVYDWYLLNSVDWPPKTSAGIAAFDVDDPEDEVFWALAVARADYDRAYYALLLRKVTQKYHELLERGGPTDIFQRVGIAEMQVAEFSEQVSYVDFILV